MTLYNIGIEYKHNIHVDTKALCWALLILCKSMIYNRTS